MAKPMTKAAPPATARATPGNHRSTCWTTRSPPTKTRGTHRRANAPPTWGRRPNARTSAARAAAARRARAGAGATPRRYCPVSRVFRAAAWISRPGVRLKGPPRQSRGVRCRSEASWLPGPIRQTFPVRSGRARPALRRARMRLRGNRAKTGPGSWNRRALPASSVRTSRPTRKTRPPWRTISPPRASSARRPTRVRVRGGDCALHIKGTRRTVPSESVSTLR